jgi:hypothetical protein
MIGDDEMVGAPAVFAPRSMRSGLVYPSLRKQALQPAEILWMCNWISVGVTDDRWTRPTVGGFCQRYDIDAVMLETWIQMVREGRGHQFAAPQRCVCPRHAYLDHASVLAVHGFLVRKGDGLESGTFEDFVDAERERTLDRYWDDANDGI